LTKKLQLLGVPQTLWPTQLVQHPKKRTPV